GRQRPRSVGVEHAGQLLGEQGLLAGLAGVGLEVRPHRRGQRRVVGVEAPELGARRRRLLRLEREERAGGRGRLGERSGPLVDEGAYAVARRSAGDRRAERAREVAPQLDVLALDRGVLRLAERRPAALEDADERAVLARVGGERLYRQRPGAPGL